MPSPSINPIPFGNSHVRDKALRNPFLHKPRISLKAGAKPHSSQGWTRVYNEDRFIHLTHLITSLFYLMYPLYDELVANMEQHFLLILWCRQSPEPTIFNTPLCSPLREFKEPWLRMCLRSQTGIQMWTWSWEAVRVGWLPGELKLTNSPSSPTRIPTLLYPLFPIREVYFSTLFMLGLPMWLALANEIYMEGMTYSKSE